MIELSILLTCHNRKEKTLQCLRNLYSASLPLGLIMEVFLVDDGSSDGTGQAIKLNFPDVNVIQGNGNLFWNQGMRLAWKNAAETKDYDFYLWLNDDTNLDKDALLNIFESYNFAKFIERNEVLICGACRTNLKNSEFSYGGRNEIGPLIPNGELQICKYINGNVVLIPKVIFQSIGNLSNNYTHGMGDYDYGLRAAEKGFICYTTKSYLATCPSNVGISGWCNPEYTLKKRWTSLHSPLGLNIKEYIIFRKKFWRKKWIFFAFKAYLKMLFPKLYKKLT
ncbi:glycosyltransferase family 2 protein [Algoriphagus sp.]|uniref:glycosyltransferase family 2 protein n=1 Tax=Algoriphagus sp. TaxID=1872435 RepID=UPI00391935FC